MWGFASTKKTFPVSDLPSPSQTVPLKEIRKGYRLSLPPNNVTIEKESLSKHWNIAIREWQKGYSIEIVHRLW